MDSVAQRVYDELTQTIQDTSGDLATYIGGLGDPIQDINDLVRDGDNGETGWSSIVDLNRIPDAGLDYLAQFIGVRFPQALDPAAKRQRIATTDGWDRGTLAAIKAAPLPYLSGTKTVIVRERDPAASPSQPAYGLTVITYKSQTPPLDWDATNFEINSDAKTNIAGYAPGTAVINRITTDGKYTGTSFQLLASGAGANFILNSPPAINGTPNVPVDYYTCSMDVKGVGAAIGKTANFQMNANGGAFANAGIASVFVTLTADWVRYSITGLVDHPDRTALIAFMAPSASVAGDDWRMCGVQFERNPGASPLIITDGAIASRPAGTGPVGAALLDQKPAGIVMVYTPLLGEDYTSLLANHPLYSNVFADFATYQGVATATPGT